jgi:CrcB protein
VVAAWAGVAVLGGVGALGRYGLDLAVARGRASPFPLGTLAVNLTASAALGVPAGAGVGGDAALLAAAALLGWCTTISTWMLESHRLGEEGDGRLALLNIALPLALGLGAAAAGWALGAAL